MMPARSSSSPNWQAIRRQQQTRPTARTRTIAALIERATIETGRPPTDEALASLLAIHVERVRHHRRLLGR